MQIDVLQTPNPDTLKFSIGKTLVENGSLEFKNKQEGKNYEVVTCLFDLGSVDLVFFGSDFISVKKKASVDWSILTDKVRKVIIEKIDNNFKPIVVENKPLNFDEIFKKIDEVLELKIRPAVAMDGGNITLRSFKDGVAEVELQGSCSGCPSSTLTLKQGVERMLKHYVPEVQSVKAVSI